MKDFDPTVRAWELGRALQEAARRRDLQQTDIAALLRWSPSKVSRVCSGKRPCSPPDVAAFLALCGVTGPERKYFLELAAETRNPDWWLEHGDHPSGRLEVLAGLEAVATNITGVATTIVPGLLQTEAYMTAAITRSLLVKDTAVEDFISQGRARQEIVEHDTSPYCVFYINEAAITCSGFPPDVMSDQVHHLLRVSVAPEIQIRVVPSRIGRLPSTGFELLQFRDRGPAVCVESLTSTGFLTRLHSVMAYQRVVTELEPAALTVQQSRDFLLEAATQIASSGDDEVPNLTNAGVAMTPDT